MDLTQTDLFDRKHWLEISKKVFEIATPIFPHIKGKKLKSEIISNLFETQSADYFNSIGIKTRASQNDREPDLFFEDISRPVEIKVTGIDHPFQKKIKWMGGKYSKRTSDYVLIVWHYSEDVNTLFGVEPAGFSTAIIQSFVDENEWQTVDSNKENYYATVLTTEQVFAKDYRFLLGKYNTSEVLTEKLT